MSMHSALRRAIEKGCLGSVRAALDHGAAIERKGACCAGQDIRDARKLIVEKLKEKGLLVKIDEQYHHAVPCCYKCGREIEPQIKEQWFVNMKPLAAKALEALDAGRYTFVTERDELLDQSGITKVSAK